MHKLVQIEENEISEQLMKQIKKEALMIYKPNFEWYCLKWNNDILCIIAVGFRKTNYRIEAIFTPKQWRGYGLATVALKQVCKLYNAQYEITADCLDSSVSMFQKVGFDKLETKHYKICNIHKCKMKIGVLK